MRVRLLIFAATALCATSAQAIDYVALVQELKELKEDKLVVDYLKVDIRTAQRLESLDQALRDGLESAKELRERAKQARQQRYAGTIIALSHDSAAQRTGEQLMAGEDPYRLEMEAAQLMSLGRDALVELVASYREVRAN